MANCCPSASSQGWNHEPHGKHLGTPSTGGSISKWAALATSQTGDCVVRLSWRAPGPRSELSTRTCKASDSNTHSTGPRIWFGSFYIVNSIEHYWAVTGDRAHLPAVCKHSSVQEFVFPVYCSKPEGHLSTHFILSILIALSIMIRNLLFH